MRLEPLTLALDGAVPVPAGAIVAYLAAHPREARDFVLDLADALIQEKDAIDPDPDLEPSLGYNTGTFGHIPDLEGDGWDGFADDEPLLGSPEIEFQDRRKGQPDKHGHIDQRHWADGQCLNDRDLCDGELVDEDGGDINDEPQDDCHQDLEPDEADKEPTLGASEGVMDQRSWADCGYGGSEEGEPSLGAPENPHDQSRWGQGRKGSREGDHDETSAFLSGKAYVQHQERKRIAREQAQALVDRCRKHPPLDRDEVVILRPGVAQIGGWHHG